jgi:hypothetical protein
MSEEMLFNGGQYIHREKNQSETGRLKMTDPRPGTGNLSEIGRIETENHWVNKRE